MVRTQYPTPTPHSHRTPPQSSGRRERHLKLPLRMGVPRGHGGGLGVGTGENTTSLAGWGEGSEQRPGTQAPGPSVVGREAAALEEQHGAVSSAPASSSCTGSR